ncbi:sugar phosphate isomerase/epimerase [Candidatus Poribacteria bacterium]|nr:sugar phosphate isomerase/epimerase [Candidatus Poribacteria bacterium]
MILMSPNINPGKTSEERDEFLRKVSIMEVQTVSMSTPADWSDADVEEARKFLEDHGIRPGEFSAFHSGFGAADEDEYQSAIEHYRRQLRHARILGAHCVGFNVGLTYRCTPQMWTDEAWKRCLDAAADLAREAEAAEMDVAAHPHIMSPLCSVERYKEMFEAAASPRMKALMDCVNLTWPHLFYRTTELVNQIFDEVGDKITALHAKDLSISAVRQNESGRLSVVHIDEAVPGAKEAEHRYESGVMDYATILRRLDELNHDVTLYVEHFPYEDTITGQQYIRHVAREVDVTIH